MTPKFAQVSSGAVNSDTLALGYSRSGAGIECTTEASYAYALRPMKRVQINTVTPTAIPSSSVAARASSTALDAASLGMNDLTRVAHKGIRALSAVVALNAAEPQTRLHTTTALSGLFGTMAPLDAEEYFVGALLQRLREEASASTRQQLAGPSIYVADWEDEVPRFIEDSYEHRDRLAQVLAAPGANFANALRMLTPIPRPAAPEILFDEGDEWLVVD